MKTPYISYSKFKKEVQRKSETERSFFFEEKWIVEAWEGISNVESIYDEPFYEEYLSYINPIVYLNWSSLFERPSKSTDYDLLLRLIVSSSIIENYDFAIVDSSKFEKYSDCKRFVFQRTPELTFRFKDFESHVLYFTSITEHIDKEDFQTPEIRQKIGLEAAKYIEEVYSFHSPLFDNTIYLSNLTKPNVDFLLKLLVFQLIEDSKECHFVLNVNFPQNIEEILSKYKQKIMEFELRACGLN